MQHTGRLAIVTGGAGLGLGSGISKVLARAGWHVLIADRDCERAWQLEREFRDENLSMHFVETNLTDEASPANVVDAALSWKRRIDGLVNNAAVGCVGRADDITDDAFDRTFAINVRAPFRLVRAVVRHLTRPGGAIVNISSVHGLQPLSGFSVYAATKGAIDAMTRGLAADFSPQGIRVNCVVPGMVDCPQTRAITAAYVGEDRVDAYLSHWARTRQMLPDLVLNTDVGAVVPFLLDSCSQGITGQSFVIDAGTTLLLTDRE